MTDLKSCRVLVTPTSYAKNDPDLRTQLEAQVGEVVYNNQGRPLSAECLLEMIPEFDGYIAGLDDINEQVIAAADRLKVIARYGVGVDKVDLEAAHKKGIVITNTPGANSTSVAELTVVLILASARNLPAAVEGTRAGDWPRLNGVSLAGKTIGLLGLGSIGQQVAQRLSGFGCQLLAHDPFVDPKSAAHLEVEMAPLEILLSKSDFLSLHCPATDQTRGMIDRDFLYKMKPGATLINTARGELVDESALYEALQSGRLRGAALDVFSSQPPDPDNPLLALPQVIPTPHMGAHTDGATDSMGWGALKNCLAVLRGEEPKNKVM